MRKQDLMEMHADLLAEIADVLIKKSEELRLKKDEIFEENPVEEPFDIKDAAERVKKTYSVGEVAEMLMISRSTVNNLINSGEVKVLQIGSIYRISKPSFDEWLDGPESEGA